LRFFEGGGHAGEDIGILGRIISRIFDVLGGDFGGALVEDCEEGFCE